MNSIFNLIYLTILLTIISCTTNNSAIDGSLNLENEFLEELIERAKDKSIDLASRKHLLDSAYHLLELKKSDSLKSKYFSIISFRYYSMNDFEKFRKMNREAVNIAIKSNDSLSLASNYWDLGSYFSERRVENDSAYYYYYKAQQLYNKTGDRFSSAKMLYNIARVQKRVKDYIGSEVTLSKAIPIYKELGKDENLYNCYNILGIVNNNLEEFDKAIFYYDKALGYLSEKSSSTLKAVRIINNKGVAFKDQEKYEKAIENYNTALSYDSVYFKSPKLHATLLDNLAYSKFKMGDTAKVSKLLHQALVIRDSLSLVTSIITSKLHLSEYYALVGDTIKGLDYVLEANKMATESNNNEDLLDSYLLLADLDKKNGVEYTKMHIALNDSLQKQERRIRNKFARIRFETDEFIDRNKQLSKQRYWIMAILAFTILFAILGYVIKSQRERNKVLEFERMQQRANEEIYNLMLTQQSKIEEGSQREKKRISEELHDGVLGRLFGTRLTLGSLNDKDDDESIKTRQLYLDELKSIEEEVRGISHELSNAMLNSEISYLTLVSELLEIQSNVGGFKYTVDSDYGIDWEHVSGNMKINIYRIIQESIQNINKYAKASNVYLNFEKVGAAFVMTVSDDGVGFDMNVKKKGIGLKNIKSRVDHLNGNLKIESAKNEGTTIVIEVPLNIIVTDEETV